MTALPGTNVSDDTDEESLVQLYTVAQTSAMLLTPWQLAALRHRGFQRWTFSSHEDFLILFFSPVYVNNTTAQQQYISIHPRSTFFFFNTPREFLLGECADKIARI